MLLQQIARDELQQTMSHLDQALYNHQQWHNDLIRTLTCRLPCDKHDIIPDAHKECRFGQWYYSNATANLLDHPGFVAIGDAHQRMHQSATHILLALQDENKVTPLDYDNFANALERLRLEIYTLKNELEILLYNRDPLTMAINRISMLPILREQQDLIRRQPHSCCIAMMDLDNFKVVNDKNGHLVGDKVLAAVAHYLIEHLRQPDKIFRYGGEEFLLFLQQVDVAQAYEMIERLRCDLEKMPIYTGQNDLLQITVSFGLTMLDPAYPVEESIDRADKALYAAKSGGRNRIEIWNHNMSQTPAE